MKLFKPKEAEGKAIKVTPHCWIVRVKKDPKKVGGYATGWVSYGTGWASWHKTKKGAIKYCYEHEARSL